MQRIALKSTLLLAFVSAIIAHLVLRPGLPDLRPATLHHVDLNAVFSSRENVSLGTYLPAETARQVVLSERVNAGGLQEATYQVDAGRVARWRGNASDNGGRVNYSATVFSSAVRFDIADSLTIPSPGVASLPYLAATEAIPVYHPEIAALWRDIEPAEEKRVLPVLRAIHDYVLALETLPFKGHTDALTALRLEAASCNGKARLFVALARLNSLPSRLVGGLVMTEGTKKTSHQWVEVFIGDQWVPFDPTNDHFAAIPAHYLQLYVGDHYLFRHSANIGFDYAFTIRPDQVSPSLYPQIAEARGQSGLSPLLAALDLDPTIAQMFLLLPLCGLVIAFLRNVVGITSFGIFMPMLVACLCLYTGLLTGIAAFTFIVLVAFAFHVILRRLKLLKIPRLAATLTLSNLVSLGVFWYLDSAGQFHFSVMSLLPIVVVCFIADRLHDLTEDRDWQGAITLTLGTLASIVTCYGVLESAMLASLFGLYPESYLLVLAALVVIGGWTGVRLSELFRFDGGMPGLIGINARNRELVGALNKDRYLRLATDKCRTKHRLTALGIPVAETLGEFDSMRDLDQVSDVLGTRDSFAIKPNRGSRGNGILIIRDRDGDTFRAAGGMTYTLDQLESHIAGIIHGQYSADGSPDTAFVEPLIQQHWQVTQLSPYGLADIRVLVNEGQVCGAMLRLPTRASGGKANLHQGAIGAAVNLETGVIDKVRCEKQQIDVHPETAIPLTGVTLPHWQAVVATAARCYDAVPLGYMGVDICLTDEGPLVLEVNGRPGLEIQNILGEGLGRRLITPTRTEVAGPQPEGAPA